MYAIIKTGGKQYKVAESDTIELERLAGDKGDAVTFGEVLMVGGDTVTVGSPLVAGASVAGEIVEHRRSATILVFKKRRRQNSKRSRGHRQQHTVVRITEILTDGKQASKAATPKKAKAEKAPVAEAPLAEAPETKAAKPKRAAPKAAAKKAPAAKKPRAKKPKTKE
jgi:large subunit ribosomal protein L21